jgi:hypothetical protein
MKEFFLSDPKLAYQALPDHELSNLLKDKFELNSNEELLHFYEDKELASIVRWEAFTECTASFHLYLHTKFQRRSDILSRIDKQLVTYFKSKGMTKAIVFAPASCKHVHKALKKQGFALEGTIKDSQIWRQKLTDTLIFGRSLNVN